MLEEKEDKIKNKQKSECTEELWAENYIFIIGKGNLWLLIMLKHHPTGNLQLRSLFLHYSMDFLLFCFTNLKKKKLY